MHAGRRPRNAGLLRGRTERPDVEVAAPLLEGRDREEELRQPPRVLLELAALGRRVAVAQDQEVHLVRGVPRLLDLEEWAGRGRRGGVDEHVLRIEDQRPDLAEGVFGVALLQDDLDRPVGGRKAQRLGESAARILRFVRGLPLAVDGREAARIEDAVRLPVDQLEEVLAEVRVVEQPLRVTRPGQGLQHYPVEAEHLPHGVARVEVVDPHGAGGRTPGRRGETQDQAKNCPGGNCSHEAVS